ncbi:hypothetical protein A3D11_01270 [Candidatus Peribacteria bacterium RIFCSPHIGHO2_02_FULL_49_16]|nr:MAG: hypothetical protein A2880_02395 [Candidatus Peribacteria bacterium RIFCSPHIGHO2_01_FULL_49_38]OGJ59578.1 MAG: hypothetical protein A3D11_01270 [Candidatus Peribacteria bacterium RIFCSPHIGHO2_02_FULL_49_16]
MSDFFTVLGIYCGLGTLLSLCGLIFLLAWRINRRMAVSYRVQCLTDQGFPLQETCSFIWSTFYDGGDAVLLPFPSGREVHLFDTKTNSSIIYTDEMGEILFAAERLKHPSSHWVLQDGNSGRLRWILGCV